MATADELAHPEHEPSRVIVKVLRADVLARDPSSLERFRREAALARELRHPGLPRLLDEGEAVHDGARLHFAVHEHVEGRTLRSLINESGTLPEPIVRQVGLQLAGILASLHAAGIVHGDVKPENIIASSGHLVRLLDLGTAGSVADDVDIEFSGTAAYAAPEQFTAGRRGPASDLYSLGVVLLEAATGLNPFAGGPPDLVRRRHVELDVPRARQLASWLSPFFDAIVACLLAKDPLLRPAGAAELAEVLAQGEAHAFWQRRGGDSSAAARMPRRAGRQGPRERAASLVGREGELSLLHRDLEEARHGRGRAVVIEGDAGLGKSSLVEAFIEGVGDDVIVLHARHDPDARQRALAGFGDALSAHLGVADLREPLLGLLPDAAPLAERLADHLAGRGAAGSADPTDEASLAGALGAVTRALARQAPVLWVIEDVHFAAPLALAAVGQLGRLTLTERVLALATTRPGNEPPPLGRLKRLERTRCLLLAPMTTAEMALLVAGAVGHDVAPSLASWAATISGGNPLLALSAVQGLRGPGALARDARGALALPRDPASTDMRGTLEGQVRSRLDQLDQATRGVVDACAVAGFRFDHDLVAPALRMLPLELLAMLMRLEREHGLTRSDGAGYRFAHHVLHEVAYGAIPDDRRSRLHADLARCHVARLGGMDAVASSASPATAALVVHHFQRGGCLGEGARLLLRAAGHLQDIEASRPLIDLVRDALALGSAVPATIRFDLLLMEAAGWRALRRTDPGRVANVEELAAVAAETGRADHAQVARIEAASLRFDRGDWRGALDMLAGEQPDAADMDMAGRLHLMRGSVHHALGDYVSSEAEFERALDVAVRSGRKRGEARATGNLGIVASRRGDHDRARELLERQLALARECGDGWAEARCQANLAILHLRAGNLGASAAWVEAASHAESTSCDEHLSLQLALSRIELALAEGRLESARSMARCARADAEGSGLTASLRAILALEATVLQWSRDAPTAMTVARRALELAEAAGSKAMQVEILGSIASMHRDLGDAGAARAALSEAAARGRSVSPSSMAVVRAQLCLLGERDADDFAVDPRWPAMIRLDTLVTLHRATGRDAHLEDAMALARRLSSHLEGAALEAFWRNNRHAREALAAWRALGRTEGSRP